MAPQYAIYPSLRDKVVVTSGAAEGIGASCVELFAQQGSRVHLLDISEDSAKELIAQIEKDTQDLAHPPKFHKCDVTDLADLKRCAQTVLDEYGGKVDVLINNAASAAGSARVGTIAVNLRHQFFLTQFLAPAMRQHGGGSVINMGSINWRVPGTGLPVYTTCKAAVLGLTRTLAKELGEHKIRVNSVMPGSIATQKQREEVLTPEYEAETLQAQALKRVLEPVEAARVVLFLAGAVTGSSYVVDGGCVGDPWEGR